MKEVLPNKQPARSCQFSKKSANSKNRVWGGGGGGGRRQHRYMHSGLKIPQKNWIKNAPTD
jgi:hypothetical protein